MVTVDNLTDDQIRVLRDGPDGLLDEALRDLCRVALQSGTATDKHPFCRVCSWRKGGVDSWNGRTCKCGLSSLPYFVCDACGGLGTVPHDVGSQPCGSCDGSGLIEPGARVLARQRIAEILNRQGER